MPAPLAILETLHHGASVLLVFFVLLTYVLLRVAPKTERRKIGGLAALFFACLGVVALGNVFAYFEMGEAATFLRATFIFLEGLCVISMVGVAAFRYTLPRLKIAFPRIFQDILLAVGYLGWLFLWLQVNHVNLTGIIATSAVLTAVIGFSLQETLGNILGGVAIQLDQSVRVGDWVQMDGVYGCVREVRWRHTSLEAPDGEIVVVPNSLLVKNLFKVLGRKHGARTPVRRSVPFAVHDCHSPLLVAEAVEKALRSATIQGVAAAPQPDCVLTSFTAGDVQYAARYYGFDFDGVVRMDSEVRMRIYLALQRLGVPFSVPVQTLTIRQDSEAQRAADAAERVGLRTQLLERVDLFAGLQPEELRRLAERLVPTPFASGDVVTRQGTEANFLYIVTGGHADVIVENTHGRSTKVAELGPGDVFGEMGLMTGEPRRANVIARSRIECLRLDKESFQEVIRLRPEVAEEISALLAARRVELDAAMENLDQEAVRARLANTRRDILGKVRSFFGIER